MTRNLWDQVGYTVPETPESEVRKAWRQGSPRCPFCHLMSILSLKNLESEMFTLLGFTPPMKGKEAKELSVTQPNAATSIRL